MSSDAISAYILWRCFSSGQVWLTLTDDLGYFTEISSDIVTVIVAGTIMQEGQGRATSKCDYVITGFFQVAKNLLIFM